MKDIAIFGAGGFGREVACTIDWINSVTPTWNLVGFFDDGKPVGQEVSHFGKILGGVNELNQYDKPLSVVIAIGSCTVVGKIYSRIDNDNIDFPNIIAPDFVVRDPLTFHMGKGNIIQGGCWTSCDVTLGDFNVLNGEVVCGHDVTIGNFNTIMPATRISGEVTIGDYNFFGVGSIVLQQIKIKNNTRLAAGSVLMTKPQEGNLYIGVPAKIFKV